MIEPFMVFGDAVDLISIKAAVGPDQARSWVVQLVRADAVRLRDVTGELRYSDTPQAAAMTSARMAARQQPTARYNPFTRSRGGSSATGMKAALPRPAVMLAGYSVHLGDLEKAIAREFGVHLSLCKNAPPAPLIMPAATGRPIEDVKAFLEVNGQDPEFGGYSRDMWIAAATTSGVVFDARHFDVAWQVAKEAGFVAPPAGRRRTPSGRGRSSRPASPGRSATSRHRRGSPRRP